MNIARNVGKEIFYFSCEFFVHFSGNFHASRIKEHKASSCATKLLLGVHEDDYEVNE